MRDNFSVLFLAETLHALDRSTTSKWKLSNLSLLTLKFTKFLQSFLEPRVSFPSNFASLFNAMRRNSSVLFHLYLYMLWTKGAHQSANLISTADIKINQILMSFFKRWVSFPLNFASPLLSWHIIPLKFSTWNILWIAHQYTIFFRFLSDLMNVHPVPHAIFEITRSGFIQILHQCPVSWR